MRWPGIASAPTKIRLQIYVFRLAPSVLHFSKLHLSKLPCELLECLVQRCLESGDDAGHPRAGDALGDLRSQRASGAVAMQFTGQLDAYRAGEITGIQPAEELPNFEINVTGTPARGFPQDYGREASTGGQ